MRCELGTICSRLSSGKNIPAKFVCSKGKYPVYGGNGLRGYTDTYNFEGECAIIGRQGAFCGNVRYFKGTAYMTEHAVVVCADENNSTQYLAYLLSTMQLGRLSGQSAQPGLSVKTLSRQIIDIPPLETQKKIASILRSLDDKIELNNKINENLQQQVAEIYKSWYQDFSQAANLPLVETEFGLIPQGWRYALLGDLCKSVSVTHKFDKDKLVFLNTGDIEDGCFLHSNYMAVKDMPGQAKKAIAPCDILYSEIRPINRHFAYVNLPSEDYVVSTKLMVIRTNGFDTRRLYHYLTSEDILSELQMQAEARSGTFPQIRFDNVSKLPMLIADTETETMFIDLLHTVYDQIEHNNLENNKLAALRDTLLPKLMSGELSQ